MAAQTLTEERVKEIIHQYLSAHLEDVDEIRRSPAGRVLIIETEVKNLHDKVDRLDSKIDSVKNELKHEIHSAKNLTVALFVALLGLVGSLVVKLFFFM